MTLAGTDLPFTLLICIEKDILAMVNIWCSYSNFIAYLLLSCNITVWNPSLSWLIVVCYNADFLNASYLSCATWETTLRKRTVNPTNWQIRYLILRWKTCVFYILCFFSVDFSFFCGLLRHYVILHCQLG